VLAFAVIMLNTDAHNPMMDTHMTRDDFIMMAGAPHVHQYTLCISLISLLSLLSPLSPLLSPLYSPLLSPLSSPLSPLLSLLSPLTFLTLLSLLSLLSPLLPLLSPLSSLLPPLTPLSSPSSLPSPLSPLPSLLYFELGPATTNPPPAHCIPCPTATSTEEGTAMDLNMLGTIFDRVQKDEIKMTDVEKPSGTPVKGAGPCRVEGLGLGFMVWGLGQGLTLRESVEVHQRAPDPPIMGT